MNSTKPGGVLTRRQFVAAGAVGGVAAAAGCKALLSGNWEFLSDSQAKTLAAICDQIVPADNFPSATQVGVIDYIDRQLVRHNRRHQDSYTNGLSQADAIARKLFGSVLADAPPTKQLQAVTALATDNPTFFDLVRNHTMQGYYGSPRHGGNRDAQSWRMLGLPEPPTRGRAQYDLRKGSAS